MQAWLNKGAKKTHGPRVSRNMRQQKRNSYCKAQVIVGKTTLKKLKFVFIIVLPSL